MAEGKVCIFCGVDCSNRPRVKDPQGRYACRQCAESNAAGGAGAAAPQAAQDADADNGFDMFEGMDDNISFPAEEMGQPGAVSGCPNCGTMLPTGAAVCMRCGFNSATGKVIKTKARSDSSKVAAIGAAGSAAAAAGMVVAAPIFWILGGSIGGIVGAAIWAIIAATTGLEIGWIAWGVGGLVGLGVALGARGNGNVMSGLVAVVIAFLAICSGKYMTWYIVLDSGLEQQAEIEWTDSDIREMIADEIIYDMKNQGHPVTWERPGIEHYEAVWPRDYPRYVIDRANTRFDAMTASDRETYVQNRHSEMRTWIEENRDTLAEIGFMSSWGMFDIIFVLLAIATAYKVGATESD